MTKPVKIESRPTRILQLSDLHFGSHDDRAWTKVHELTASEAAETKGGLDYIVVTGDLQNHPFAAMREVRKELEKLSKHCFQLLVVPGNHDYLIFGSFDRRLAFRILMLALAPLIPRTLSPVFALFYAIPAWAEVRIAALWAHCFWPSLLVSTVLFVYLWLPWGAFRLVYRRWWPKQKVILDAERGVLLALLDSNSIRSNWARGRVGGRQLDRLSRRLNELDRGKQHEAYEQAVKIAFLHHHPYPIVRQESGLGPLSGRAVEEMLMLDDASEVLRSLAEEGFDVVLHGHKHRAAATRIETEMDEGIVKRSILVAACGSSCLKGEAQFSANLLTITPSRHAVLDRYITRDPIVSGFRPVKDSLLVSTGAVASSAAKSGYKARKNSFSCEVDADGDAKFTHTVEGLERIPGSSKRPQSIRIKLPNGTLHDFTINSGHLRTKQRKLTNNAIVCRFGQWDSPPAGTSGYDFSYWSMGLWLLNADEFHLVHGQNNEALGGCHVFVGRATESLEFTIQLPDSCQLKDRPRMNFYTLEKKGNEQALVPALGRVLDAGLLWSPERNMVAVKLNDPPVGIYELLWDLPHAPKTPAANPRARSKAEAAWGALREDLLAMGATGAPTPLVKLSGEVLLVMQSVCPMIARAFNETGPQAALPDRFEVTLMVYAPTKETPGLRIVSHNQKPGTVNTTVRLPVGTGIAGRASKTGKPLVYHVDINSKDGKPIPYATLAGQTPHEVLYSFPLQSKADSSVWTGIVLNIGAYSNGGPLLPTNPDGWDSLVEDIGAQVLASRDLLTGAWSEWKTQPFEG